jgi:hypothetical protein
LLDQCDYKREADNVPPGGALSYIHAERVEASLSLNRNGTKQEMPEAYRQSCRVA